ncbi:Uncharacterized protein dnm_080120 [Desulfonema magnum]|uniref:Uncharacterized protein n=1 Tax=Desulfonema magnum TaxID=45655 RepID=A0A975BUF7_9BACT|nr:Uncharacterized protein dnm_080120 [Desulfonema magnum]
MGQKEYFWGGISYFGSPQSESDHAFTQNRDDFFHVFFDQGLSKK